MSQQLCPDILGVLSDERITVLDVLQCALGVFPPTTAIGQPVEVLLLLQNLIDQPLTLQMTVKTPVRDAQGGLLNLFTPKPRLTLTLPPAETGMLHIPVTPLPPTGPGKDYPVLVQVGVKKPDIYRMVRPIAGGHKPSLLAISPFRVAVLREVGFRARTLDAYQLGVTFDVLPGQFPPRADEPMPRYEALWTMINLEEEQARVKEISPEALRFTRTLSRVDVYEPLLEHTQDRYADAGLPLHPGEAIYIAKMMTYVMENGLELEPGFTLVDSAWFQRLCWLMANDPNVINDSEQLVRLLYSAVLQDAVLVAFSMVAHQTRADFGSREERVTYATRLVGALEGQMLPALEHIYVPLVMGGTLLVAQMIVTGEKPWRNLELLQEAIEGRVSLAGANFREVFGLLDRLIEKAQRVLTEQRIPKE